MLSPKGALAAFLVEPRPTRAVAVSALRLAFVLMFLSQAAVALLVVALILLLNGGPVAGASVLGAVLALLAYLQCLLGLLLPDALARSGSRGSVLSATLLAGVLLATPAWFLMLALVTGQRPLPLLLLLTAVLGGYASGFWLTGRLGARAAAAAPTPDGPGSRQARREDPLRTDE